MATEKKARTPSKAPAKPRDESGMTEGEKRKAAAVSPVNGQPVPKGKPFTTGDPRAKEAQRKGVAAKKEKANLQKLCRLWMEEAIATGNNGEKLSGGEMMVKVAAKKALSGNPKFWELLRDTAGFKPVDRVMVSEVEPAVIAEVEQMVQEAANE